MKYKYLAVLFFFTVLPFIIGCGSGSYNIEDRNDKDTTKFKSTGAKLKNFYKIQSSPWLTLQITGGLNLGMAELSSNYQNVFDSLQFSKGLNFGVKNGYNFMLTGKIPLHKQGNVRLNISAAFNRFTSSFLATSSPYGKVSYNVYSFGAGVENSFNPSFRLKPYVAGELTANIINGEASIISSTTGETRNVKIRNSFRLGYMIYGGLEYMFNNYFGINGGLKLTNSNQAFKQTKSSSDPNEVTLRDKKVDREIIEFGGFKNFIFTTFFVGVNIYFGVNDIVYRFNK